MDVWVVGQLTGGDGWELIGVYSTEALAVAACLTEDYFVGRVVVDETALSETTPWPGAYCPKRKTA